MTSAPVAEIVKAIDSLLLACKHDQWHGCATGDCPHDRASDCVTALVAVLREHAQEAEQVEIRAEYALRASPARAESERDAGFNEGVEAVALAIDKRAADCVRVLLEIAQGVRTPARPGHRATLESQLSILRTTARAVRLVKRNQEAKDGGA